MKFAQLVVGPAGSGKVSPAQTPRRLEATAPLLPHPHCRPLATTCSLPTARTSNSTAMPSADPST